MVREVWFVERSSKKRIKNNEVIAEDDFCAELASIIYSEQNLISRFADSRLAERVCNRFKEWMSERLAANLNKKNRSKK